MYTFCQKKQLEFGGEKRELLPGEVPRSKLLGLAK